MLDHMVWMASLLGAAKQKILKIYEAGSPREVLITLYDSSQTQAAPGGDQAASTAAPAGWAVTVAYRSSPDTVIFQKSFGSDKEASDAFSDIVNSAAEAEGYIRQENFEKAQEASQAFLTKMKSNTSDVPNGAEL